MENIIDFLRSFNIKEELIRGTVDLGYTALTDVQEQTIPYALSKIDIFAQAPTGTGKTYAFAIPILQNIDTSNDKVSSLILAPTRELAMQIASDLREYGKYLEGVRIACVYGGQDIERQIRDLKKKPQIVVATPGRLIDHLERHTIKLDNIKHLVLDEADEMLNMGFREDVNTILSNLKTHHQTMLFSATFPDGIKQICEEYLIEPKRIKIVSKSLTVDTVKQFYIIIHEKDKVEALSRIIDLFDYKSVMVFCNTKRKVDEAQSALLQRNYLVEGIHGDMKQMQRDMVMSRFKAGLINILVASDVAARGLDIDDVDCVINYDVPDDEEYYIHRIGRTGRAKKEGIAISLVNTNEKYKLRGIIAYTKASIEKMEVPDLAKVMKVRIKRIIDMAILRTMDDSIKSSKSKKMIEKTISEIIRTELIDKQILAEDIIKGLILMQMKEDNEIDTIEERLEKVSKKDSIRFFINMGKKNGLEKAELKYLICKMIEISDKDILAFEMHDDFSFFELNRKYKESAISAFAYEKYKGKRIIVEEAKEKGRDKAKDKKTSSKGRPSKQNTNSKSTSKGKSKTLKRKY